MAAAPFCRELSRSIPEFEIIIVRFIERGLRNAEVLIAELAYEFSSAGDFEHVFSTARRAGRARGSSLW
jgi:hypothetical protein